jgi:hypothetical protein
MSDEKPILNYSSEDPEITRLNATRRGASNLIVGGLAGVGGCVPLMAVGMTYLPHSALAADSCGLLAGACGVTALAGMYLKDRATERLQSYKANQTSGMEAETEHAPAVEHVQEMALEPENKARDAEIARRSFPPVGERTL